MSRRRAGALLLLLSLVAGCGLKPASAFVPEVHAAGIRPVSGLKGAKITVTSKEFTEQLVLGKIAVLALTAAGADVTDKTNVQGSVNARRLILRGGADLMWEYTGTAWITYLGKEKPIENAHKQFTAVRDLDLRKNQVDWLDPAPLNNTYAMAITQASARKYGLSKLSDIREVPKEERTFCVAPEFFSRSDGLRGMLKAYGLDYGSDVPTGNVRQMSEGVIFTSIDHGTCTFGEVFETDGRIRAMHLKVLADDEHFFPNYNAAISIRESVLKAHPEISRIFAKISPKLTTATMRRLNAHVDVGGEEPVFVARDWLRSQGLIR